MIIYMIQYCLLQLWCWIDDLHLW